MLFGRACAVVGLLAWAVAGAPYRIYVSPGGNDTYSGSLEAPLQTLQAASDRLKAVVALKGLPDGGVEVVLRGGDYYVNNVTLDAAHSGQPGSPVVFKAHEEEHVRIHGGGYQLGTAPWTRLANDEPHMNVGWAKPHRAEWTKHIFRTWLPGKHIAEIKDSVELFCNGKPMTPARYPNRGWLRILDATAPDGGRSYEKFWFSGYDGASGWAPHNTRVCGYLYWDFLYQCTYIEEVHSISAARTVDGEPNPPAGATGMIVAPEYSYGYLKDGRFFVENAELELDSPGEYYFNHITGEVLFWPPEGVTKTSQVAFQPCCTLAANPEANSDSATLV